MSIQRGAIAVFFTCSLLGQTAITLKNELVWTDTNLDVKAQETIRVTAEGSLQYPGSPNAATPQGLGRSFKDVIRNFPVNSSGRGAVIAKVGDSAAFLVGNSWEGKAPISGRLFVGINQGGNDKGEGTFTVKVERVTPAPENIVTDWKLPLLSQAQLDSVPTRVQDAQGTEGDRVNFFLVGDEKQVVSALKSAGWVIVDKDTRAAVFTAIIATLSKQSYVTMPMSELKLFGRSQDYGFAIGDPVRVVASRHHFRIWKAPFTVNGITVFAGAGTHDIGFDKDQRNNGVTHKIDPDTDLEREFIAKSLQDAGVVSKLDYMKAGKTFITGKTAHGEEFRTDGRTLVVYLTPLEN